ncbi:hypothetical protein SMU81_09714 [Streptococcus mutans SF14]|nr:hypothetical protein SMU81_09714 [Streptococcus mutans SF14]
MQILLKHMFQESFLKSLEKSLKSSEQQKPQRFWYFITAKISFKAHFARNKENNSVFAELKKDLSISKLIF